MSNENVLGAVKWSFAGELCARAVQPIVFVVMAKLLTPADFGIAAAGVMAISFSQIFWEGGLAKAIIQRQSQVEAAASTAFWMNAILGSAVAVILFIAAPFIADHIFHDAKVAAVLRVMVFHILLGSLASIPTALIQKNMQFDRIFWIRVVTVVVPGLLSVPLALAGWSYWALVAGTLTGQLAQTVAVRWVGKWRPALSFEPPLAAEIFRFGRWSVLSGLLNWFYIWADSLVVGFFLGSRDFGIYRTGSQFVAMIYSLMFAPILPVLYSHFSGFSSEHERVSRVLTKVMQVLTFVSLPVGFVIFTFSSVLEQVFFGAQWQGVALVIGVMGLVQGYAWIVSADGEAYRAIGKPSYETIVSGFSVGLYLLGYLVSIHFGIESFMWTRLGLALVAIGFHLALNRYVLKVDVISLLKSKAILTVAGILLYTGYTFVVTAPDIWMRVVVPIVCAVGMVWIAFLPRMKAGALQVWGLARKGIGV